MPILDKLSGVAKNVGDKASGAIETTKLNGKINSEKNAIEGVYKKIGEYYYRQYKSGESLPDEVVAFCAEIDKHNTAIDEAKAEIERIKSENASTDEFSCPSCGKANTPNTKFCQECGTKLEAVEKTCGSCSVTNEADTKFCRECGERFE